MKPQKCAKNGFPVVVGVIIFCAFLWPVSAQRKSGDPNKFAVIINGAGGEEVYAKQWSCLEIEREQRQFRETLLQEKWSASRPRLQTGSRP